MPPSATFVPWQVVLGGCNVNGLTPNKIGSSVMGELPTPSSASVRVLVVDDFEPARRSICSILSTQEQLHVVGEAADGLQAVQKTLELQPHLILLDIGLSHLNGIEAASQIRKIAPDTKILFISQINDAGLVHAALSNGGKGYVLKADAGSELLRAIEAVLRDEIFVSTAIVR